MLLLEEGYRACWWGRHIFVVVRYCHPNIPDNKEHRFVRVMFHHSTHIHIHHHDVNSNQIELQPLKKLQKIKWGKREILG